MPGEISDKCSKNITGMKSKERYEALIRMLRTSNPELRDKEKLINRIMNGIDQPKKGLTFREQISGHLFGWADLQWSRAVMAVAAIFFLCFFIVQQGFMWNRLNSLEEQLVKPASQTWTTEPTPGTLHRSLINVLLDDRQANDSVTVSREELEALLDEYFKMSERLQSIQPAYDRGSGMNRLLRDNAEKNDMKKKSL